MEHFIHRLRLGNDRWRQSGKDPALLMSGMAAALADLWMSRHERDQDGVVTPDLHEFIAASVKTVDLSDVWEGRIICPGCGERYRLENTSTCVECSATFCWRCAAWEVCRRCGGEVY